MELRLGCDFGKSSVLKLFATILESELGKVASFITVLEGAARLAYMVFPLAISVAHDGRRNGWLNLSLSPWSTTLPFPLSFRATSDLLDDTGDLVLATCPQPYPLDSLYFFLVCPRHLPDWQHEFDVSIFEFNIEALFQDALFRVVTPSVQFLPYEVSFDLVIHISDVEYFLREPFDVGSQSGGFSNYLGIRRSLILLEKAFWCRPSLLKLNTSKELSRKLRRRKFSGTEECSGKLIFDISVGARGRDGKIIRITRDTETSTSTPMNPPERIRPTASRRRRRMIIEDDDEGHNDQGEPSTVHEEDVVHEHMVHEQVDVHEQEEAAPAHEGEHMEEEHDGAEGPGELTRYPGGPYDLYVLTRYRYHVSARLWFGEERPLLKIVAHGKKMQQFTPPVLPRPIENWVNLSGLNPLQRGSLKMIDNNLISAFVERWHSETSSFHMPFGEMTITLDDVANLLGLPIRGEFYSPPDVDRVTACNLAVHLLGVTTEEIWEETRKTRGAHYRLDWLKEVFRRQCAAERFDCAARAYLLNLVGSTIFADKSHTLVDAKYLPLFRYLDGIDRYAWGTAALVVLYDYLSDACYYDTKQLGGYMTLLQCWIYEYFPNICNRGDQGADVECFARMNRWCYKQGKHKVHEYRSIIDALTPADVIWRPWENHRGVIPFDDITLYTGHIRLCSTVAKYLPERCLRQFGYIQYIPSPPLPDPARLFDVDVEWLGYVTPVTELFPKLRPATYPSECEDGYLEWFYQVSHPLLVRPDGVPQVPRYSVPPTSADASSSQPPPILQQIGDLIQQGLSEHQASPDDELYRHFYKALYLSRSRTS
uniref:Uncharacterized protein LOC101488734 n=2 Tax=Cicer arietinum TaxID=3827 RepID=A0A1S2Z5K4_CICAR|nr:uncharacterized protein LOC101488734 [Cicer arietinum]